MTLSDISIHRPVFAWMLMFGLIIFGGVAFTRMGVSQLPDVDFPVISISLTLDGAAPEVMETDIVDVIEDGVMTIAGVRSISSSSRNSSATVTVEFDLNKNLDVALQDVQAKIAQIQRNLPREMDPAVISKTNPEDQPILWLTLRSDKIPFKEMNTFVRDRLKDQFSTVSGVGDIVLGGFLDPNLRIWVDDKQLDRYQLAVNDVIGTIQSEHAEPPAGRVETDEKEFNVRTLGEATSVEEFGNILISSRGGQPNYARIRVRQVSEVEEGLADVRRISRSMGLPAIGLGIRKQRGANAVATARAVKAKMAQVQKTLPPGYEMTINFDSTTFIEEAVGELNFTLLLSALLTAVVCWIFVGSWSATFNVLMAIPTSIIGTFIFLYFSGFTLNMFTLLALSLAIGIVVDDAIMVLENIFRHQEMGKSRVKAALEGSREITFAAVAATVSILAIFVPLAFMIGIIGKFLFQFGVTISVAVMISLLEALTLTPMRASRMGHVGERTTRFGRGVEAILESTGAIYKKSLGLALARRWWVIGGAMVFLVASFAIVKYVNKEFLPAEDQSRFMVRVQTPVGSSIKFTDEKMKQIEKFLATRSEVDRYYVAVGGFGGGEVNTGIAFITLKEPGHRGKDPKTGREPSQFDVMAVARQEFNKIKDVKATVQDLSMRGFTASRGFPIEFTVQGPDFDELAKYTTEMMKRMEASGLMTDVDTDYQTGMPEIHVIPDREKAAARGVSVSAIGQTINSLIGGVLVGKYPKGGRRYDIRLKLKEDLNRDRRDRIKSLYVRNNRGELIPLSEVVKIEEKPTLQVISRKDRERAVSIFSNISRGASQQSALEEIQKIGKEVLPTGYRVVLSGGSQTFKESFQSLLFALMMGLLVAYMVLASQFNSFIHPVTVLLALPFSISGAFVALFVSNQSLNIYSMIGLILLMGIVKKNSILLVDFTNQVREEGEKAGKRVPVYDALMRACPTRLRPILMTSIATVAGAVPPALAIGPGAESRIPMAITVIGGVLVSTVLTLYVVPCAYSLFSRLERKSGEDEELRGIAAKEQRRLVEETV